MADLRELLEQESERVSLPHDAAERLFERGRRREHNRRIAALGVGVAVLIGVLLIIRSGLPGADRTMPVDPSPSPPATGRYTVSLSPEDEAVRRLGLDGTYTLGLTDDGELSLSAPASVDLPGDPVTFAIAGRRFTTDLLVGNGCDSPGVYRWTLDGRSLTFEPVGDDCEQRVVLLASQPWAASEPAPAPDPLQGDWTATFSCSRMVRAVREAPVQPDVEAFWRSAVASELGSGDPDDPCAGADEPISFTFRFDDGRILIFDSQLREGFDGFYTITGRSFILRDGAYRNIVGQYRVVFDVAGDRISFDLVGRGGSDAFFVATWESSAFIRQT